MSLETNAQTPPFDRNEQAGLEAIPVEDGLHVVPKQPGLEVPPADPGLLPYRDDEKMVHSEDGPEARPPRRLCGIPVKIFWTLVVVLALVLVAIAIGVGVGVSEKSSTKNGGCVNGATCRSNTTLLFQEFCNTNFMVETGVEGVENSTARDDGVLNVSTFHECMDACAANTSQVITATGVYGRCLSVTWDSSFYAPGRCVKKNATAAIGSENRTVYKLHASPSAQIGLQSANVITKFYNEDGNPLTE
ncbi:MAG: hypothetical protein M1828_001674 [Chrysothrix sp. TS-e1954]|nr:MAG: hypothetical protein M1828_001674 [Chrysothrix sp. TS-e1954]